jgi:NADH-quinone oxidoreductase subunit M
MSSVGLPGTNGFIGEFMVLSGAFVSQHLGANGVIFAILGATGVILAAIYMLHAVLKMFWGPLDNDENRELKDLNGREAAALVPLLVLVFWIGLYPAPFLSRIEPAVKAFAMQYTAKLYASDKNPESRGLLQRSAQLAAPAGDGALALGDAPLKTATQETEKSPHE